MTVASVNYTGRKRIKQRQFSCKLLRDEDLADISKVSVELSKGLMQLVEDEAILVLDIVNRADHERFELSVIPNQTITTVLCSKGSKSRYRLSIVETISDRKGAIRASSEEFFLSSGVRKKVRGKKTGEKTKEEINVPENFFEPVESEELGEQPWRVHCEDEGEVIVYINRRLMNALDNNSKNPILRAMMFPPMIRTIFEGIFMRAQSVETIINSDSEKWFKWAKYLLGEDYPSEDFFTNSGVNEIWTEWLDKVLEEFCSRSNSANQTLLSALEAELHD